MMAIDNTTGLPELPEGEFWRVTFPSSSDHAYLQLMHRRDSGAWLGAATREESVGIYGGFFYFMFHGDLLPQHKVRPRHIRHAARKIIRERAKTRNIHKRADGISDVYGGDYPPLRLPS